MKKAWGALLAAVLLCMAAAVPAFGADAPTLELRPSVQAVSPGGEFTVDLYIYNNPGIAGLNFAIRYDESVLRLFDFDDKGQPLTGWEVGIKANPQDDEPVREEKAVWAQLQNWTGSDCCILRLSFRVLENAPTGETAITIDGLFAMNAGREKVSFNITPAAVTIQQEPPPPIGVSVGGTAVSWNEKADAEYYLYPATMEDKDIRAQWKTGATVSGYVFTGTGGDTGSTTVDGRNMYSQTFSFSGVTAGKYKLVIFKPGKYVPKIVPITVNTSDCNCGQQKLWLYGDVNYDGKIRTNDATMIYQSIAKKITLSDEQFLVADVNQDSKVRTNDATEIYKKIANKDSVFNSMA